MNFKQLAVVIGISLVIVACGDGQGFSGSSSSVASDSHSTGKAGSLSRFNISGNMLYAINNQDIQLFDITDPSQPAPWSTVFVNWGIETLFTYNNYLFVGAEAGVYIYDNSDPAFPVYKGEFEHARSCDPVVVQGSTAYVTLRGGGRCWGSSNQLDILDVSDPMHPSLVRSYPMQGPAGLGVDGNKLFVCDGIAGLKQFDVTNPISINHIKSDNNIECYDVIPNDGILLVSAVDGLYQYDYSGAQMDQLSAIKVQ